MKVLHVNTHMNIGGIGQYIASLSKALKPKSVECVTASSGGDLEIDLKSAGIRHISLDMKTKFEFGPKVFRAASSLARIVKDEKIDLLHAHTRVSQVASLFASRGTGVPFISTCHGHFKPRLSRRLFDTWGVKVVAVSDAVKAHLERDFNVDAKRIEVIYSGVDVKRFSDRYSDQEILKAKETLGIKAGPVIGTMGRLSPVKGQKFLIEAMKKILLKRPDAKCLVIGSGPEEEALKELAGSLGIGKSVVFTPSTHDNAPLYLSCMDIFALPSIEEGLGLALLEAMNAGLPCIASATGGIRDIMQDGVNGMLAPVGDSGAIASAAIKILNDGAFAKTIAERARGLVRDKFSIDLMADRMKDLYKRVIDG